MTTLEMLLNQLANNQQPGLPPGLPPGAQPMMLGPLEPPNAPTSTFELPPGLPPLSPEGLLDQKTIDEYLSFAGPAPLAPTPRRAGKLERIAGAFTGVGEGLAGRGAQYVERLKEERDRPMREYERKLERYEDRRSQLGLAGYEAAERKREREQAAIQRRADMQAEREFNEYLRRNDFVSDMAKEQLRQTFALEKESRRIRAAVVEAERQQRAQQERDARHTSDQFFGLTKNKTLSDEIGAYRAGLRDSLSPAAVALERRVTEMGNVDMARAMSGARRGSGGVSNAAMRALAVFSAALEETRGAVSRGDVRGEQAARRKLDAAYGRLSAYPGQVERGIGDGWPWAKPAGQGGGQQPQQQTQFNLGGGQQGPSVEEVRAYAQRFGMSEAQARQELMR